MFPGQSYGVAVSVAELDPALPDFLPAEAIGRPMRLDEMLPAEFMADAELSREIEACIRVEAVVAAYKAERIAQLAARRPASADLQPGEPGAAAERDERVPEGVSEFFPDELAMTANCSRTGATVLADVSLTLVTTLRATWMALAEGRIDYPRARALALELGPPARDTDPTIIGAVEAAVLPLASQLSVKRLRAAARKELVARDADAAEQRRKRAARSADVVVHPIGDGMSQLVTTLPTPLAAAAFDTLDRYARMAKADGDERSLGQLRSAFHSDLVLRSWDDSRPPVTAHVTVDAPLPALQLRPGSVAEVDGQPITAAHVRELLESLDALCPGGLQAPTGGTLTVAITAPDSGELLAAPTLTELRRVGRRGCGDHPDASCSCPVLERPPPVDRYRPTPAQRRWGTTRDRTCRHPGCGNQAGWADLDHVIPHARGGPTDCANLCCLCRRHHRLKTHARGWRFVLHSDGTLSVTSPSGVTRTTRPPGLHALAEYRPVPPAELAGPADDPPPF
jgi:hypothetical protein